MRSAEAGDGNGSAGAVLRLFRAHGSLTRSDVMHRSGLARSTVQQRIDALVDAGLILPVGGQLATRGRPAGQFDFNHDHGVLLVADIGATGLRAALCDLRGTVTLERSAAADVATGPEAILSVVVSLFSELLTEAGRGADHVAGVGVDVPGPVDFTTGRVISPPIMTGWDRYDIPGRLEPHYACPVVVDNDVNAMAFGEQRVNYPEVSNLLMLKIGTGIGAGIVTGGHVQRGADGAAGDIGHIHLNALDSGEELVCRCGNTGCVEAYASGWALVRDLKAAGADVNSVEDVITLIRSGDTTAVRLARRTGRILGSAIADAVSLLNPRVVVIGGQLAQVEEQLFAGIREVVYRRSLPLATRRLQITASTLHRRAGLIGMALLLADTIFTPERVEALLANKQPATGRAATAAAMPQRV